MSALLESLARDKRALVDRSALCRLRLRRDAHALSLSLDWRRAPLAAAVSAAPALRAIAWTAALSVLGAGRVARWLALAGRVALAARIARALIAYARSSPTRASRSPPGNPSARAAPPRA